MLLASAEPLVDAYDLALVDLDGVVYRGSDVVAHAAESLDRARGAGMGLVFVTNNASREPESVAAQLVGLGIAADDEYPGMWWQLLAEERNGRLGRCEDLCGVGGDAQADELGGDRLRFTRCVVGHEHQANPCAARAVETLGGVSHHVRTPVDDTVEVDERQVIGVDEGLRAGQEHQLVSSPCGGALSPTSARSAGSAGSARSSRSAGSR